MSGGVDSSVAAVLLVEQGFEVAGITITPFKVTDECRDKTHAKSCCSYASAMEAAEISRKLGIEHFLVDHTELFRETVVNNFIGEYLSGRTPNPCVICNRLIKWDQLLKKADAIGAKYLATGHYAKLRQTESGMAVLQKGSDPIKDQSYFLWNLTKEHLSRTVFPIGNINKAETRAIAERLGLAVAKKPDSQEVCFIPDNDYRRFLVEVRPEIESKLAGGEIIFDGKVIGRHKGFPFYTIGQRRGLGISHSEPLFVKEIDAERNKVIVGTDPELLANSVTVGCLNLQKFDRLPEDRDFIVKIRYRDSGAPARCTYLDSDSIRIDFSTPRRAITPGQSVVIYDDEDLVGGGIIIK